MTSKTTSRSRYGNLEFMVMLFGLANTPVAFMDIMNKVFKLGLQPDPTKPNLGSTRPDPVMELVENGLTRPASFESDSTVKFF